MQIELTKDEFLLLEKIIEEHKLFCETTNIPSVIYPGYDEKFVKSIENIYAKLIKIREGQQAKWKQNMMAAFLKCE